MGVKDMIKQDPWWNAHGDPWARSMANEKPAVSKNYDAEIKVAPSEAQSEEPKEMEMVWTTPTTGRPKCAGCEDRIHEPVVYRRGLPFHEFCAQVDEEEEIGNEIWRDIMRRNEIT